MIADSTQRTSSKSLGYQNTSVEIVVSLRRNWNTPTHSHCLVASRAADALSHLTFLTFLRLQGCLWSDTTKRSYRHKIASRRWSGHRLPKWKRSRQGFESGESINTPLR